MAASNKVPDNLNYLSNISFRLMIEDTPHLTWFCQSVNVPGVAIEAIEMVNPFANIPYAGSNVTFEELSITFIVDEHLKNWIEIYDRVIALGLGEGTEKFVANPPEEGAEIRLSGTTSPELLTFAEQPFGRIPISGVGGTDRTRVFIGSGSLKKFCGAAECITFNPEERQILFSFTG